MAFFLECPIISSNTALILRLQKTWPPPANLFFFYSNDCFSLTMSYLSQTNHLILFKCERTGFYTSQSFPIHSTLVAAGDQTIEITPSSPPPPPFCKITWFLMRCMFEHDVQLHTKWYFNNKMYVSPIFVNARRIKVLLL